MFKQQKQPLFDFEIPSFHQPKRINGKFKQKDEDRVYEPLSYKKVKKLIEDSHPIDPYTKKRFGIGDRITVKSFYLKILDIFNCYNLEALYKKIRKSYMRNKNIQSNQHWHDDDLIEVPEYLKNQNLSGSHSSESEEER